MLASVLPYATLLTAMIALVSVVLSTIHGRRLRQLEAAIELVHSIQPPEFASSIQRILELPEDAEPELVLDDPDAVRAAYVVSHVFESLGVLVFYRLLPLHLVDHLSGGYVRSCWRRLRPYVERRRQLFGAMFGEWFQWLTERLLQDPAPGKDVGAHRAHRRWRA